MRQPIALVALSLWVISGAVSAELDEARKAELTSMLHQDCGSCHGLTLRGGLGPALLPETLQGKPREFLIATILDGRPGTAMPPWRPLLQPEEVAWLVDLILAEDEVVR